MKSLDSVLKIEGDHVIIDCCPRKGSRELPINHPNLEHAYVDSEFRSDFTAKRAKYTLYMNIGILMGITCDEDELIVKCQACDSTYRLTHDLLRNLFNTYIDNPSN